VAALASGMVLVGPLSRILQFLERTTAQRNAGLFVDRTGSLYRSPGAAAGPQNTRHRTRLAILACIAAAAWSTPALAAGSSLPYGGGGRFAKFDPIVQEYNQSGESFRIAGHCQSSCTLFLGIRNVCIEPNAVLLFHGGGHPNISAAAIEHMLNAYNSSLRAYLLEHHALETKAFFPVSGTDMIRKFGYRKCQN
jgi:hypothetical protein